MNTYTQAYFDVQENLAGKYPISYVPNRLYPAKIGGNLYWYINTKGFLHVKKPRRINEIDDAGNKILYGYEIVDYLIKPDGNLKETGCYGHFVNLEDCARRLNDDCS